MSDQGPRTHLIHNAKDGNGEALGQTADTSLQSYDADYKTYEGTLSETTELDFLTDAGRKARGAVIINDSGSADFSVSFKISSSGSYGDTLTVKSGETLSIDHFILFAALKLTFSASADYRVLIY